jgi:hypothetical protein
MDSFQVAVTLPFELRSYVLALRAHVQFRLN